MVFGDFFASLESGLTIMFQNAKATQEHEVM